MIRHAFREMFADRNELSETLRADLVAVYDGEIRTEEGHGKFVARSGNTPTNKALSQWKELTAPRPVERTGIPATGV